MTASVESVAPSDTLASAIQTMQSKKVRRLPVLEENGALVGVLSESDIRGVSPFFGKGQNPADIHSLLEQFEVREQMSGSPVTIGPERTLADAIRYFLKGRFGCLPVLSNGQLVGILTASDVLRATLKLLGEDPSDQSQEPS